MFRLKVIIKSSMVDIFDLSSTANWDVKLIRSPVKKLDHFIQVKYFFDRPKRCSLQTSLGIFS